MSKKESAQFIDAHVRRQKKWKSNDKKGGEQAEKQDP